MHLLTMAKYRPRQRRSNNSANPPITRILARKPSPPQATPAIQKC
ncbi:hypothetical protein CsSME_00021222 [Camellia sinensis var. sinensis]